MHNLDQRARVSPVGHLPQLTVDGVDLTQEVFHLNRERQILELVYAPFWLHVKKHDNKKKYFADPVMDRVMFHLINRGFAAQCAARFQESRRVLDVRNTFTTSHLAQFDCERGTGHPSRHPCEYSSWPCVEIFRNRMQSNTDSIGICVFTGAKLFT